MPRIGLPVISPGDSEPCGDLVEQRLEEMKVATVDKCDLNGRMPQRFRGIEPAEAAAEDDDALCDTFRIAGDGA